MSDIRYHTTVLLHEGVDALGVNPNGIYVDATLGAGGHSREVLQRLGDSGRLLAFDQDADAVANAPQDSRFELCFGNFRFLKQFLFAKGVRRIDGLIADLGVSGHHFDAAERGFSFRFDAPLDMRMNKGSNVTAADVLNGFEYADLKRILKIYGESAFAAALSKAIVKERELRSLSTTADLMAIVNKVVPRHKVGSEMPKVFQAVRIEVNDELGALKDLLVQSVDMIKPDGKLVILSYHSLEDRMVKHFFRSGNFEDLQEKDVFGNIIRPFDPSGKVITPSHEEIKTNPRARSAKMRVALKRK